MKPRTLYAYRVDADMCATVRIGPHPLVCIQRDCDGQHHVWAVDMRVQRR